MSEITTSERFSECSWLLQVALLRWLCSQSEEDRTNLTVVTALQVGRELLNRITGQDKVDAYKVPCAACRGRCEPCTDFHCDLFWSSERLHPEHRAVPPREPARLAGPHQRRGGEEGPAVRRSGQSSGDGADILRETPTLNSLQLKPCLYCMSQYESVIVSFLRNHTSTAFAPINKLLVP